MNEEISVGNYVRTKEGIIGKVEQIGNSLMWLEDGISILLRDMTIKHSKNIIDLIQEGDYVNGMKVEIFYDTYNESTGEYEDILGFPIYDDALMNCITEVAPLTSIDIKSIVTSEQFKSIKYVL